MDCPENPRQSTDGGSNSTGDSFQDAHPEIESGSWRDLTEFDDQFDDAIFGVLTNPDDSPSGFWIVRPIQKARPAAVSIDQGHTFDLTVLGLGAEVVWLTCAHMMLLLRPRR